MSQLPSIGIGELIIIGLYLATSGALVAGALAAILILRERKWQK